MAGEVGATGKGFLTSTGQIKDRKSLAVEEQQSINKTESRDSISAASKTDFSKENVSGAFSSVRTRFSEDVNSVVNVINENDANLKKANDNVKQQIKAAKELKDAIQKEEAETDETKKAELRQVQDAKRQEIQKLQSERDAIAEKIEKDNKARSNERVQSISFGNKPKALVKVEKVEFEKSEPKQDLESKEGVDDLISKLQTDRENIQAQRRDLREVKKEVKQVVKEVRSELKKIESAAIASVDEAQRAASKIATDVVKGGAEAALVSKVDESVVKELVGA